MPEAADERTVRGTRTVVRFTRDKLPNQKQASLFFRHQGRRTRARRPSLSRARDGVTAFRYDSRARTCDIIVFNNAVEARAMAIKIRGSKQICTKAIRQNGVKTVRVCAPRRFQMNA